MINFVRCYYQYLITPIPWKMWKRMRYCLNFPHLVSSDRGYTRDQPITAQQKWWWTNQNRALSPCDQIDVTSSHIWASNSRDPMGKRTRTHKRWIHILGIVLLTVPRKAWWQVGRMRSSDPDVSPAQSRDWDHKHMRKPPNDSPGPPHS